MIHLLSQVAVDKQNTKRKLRYGATIRATESANGIPLQQQTVIYTIPTTRQLSQQYPQMVTTYPPQSQQGQNNPPPYLMGKRSRSDVNKRWPLIMHPFSFSR